ncbi:MAG TPA: ferritin-like domain-containing protein [Microvirga sp.]|jgi:ferritin-like metal-binding protein YciE|nr:ferritin-like domain-containing protein [Microvirga sp.]
MANTMTDLTGSETAHSIFITGLVNAHALEKQALQIMNRQIERLQRYPEMEQLLRQHVIETEEQIRRIDEILHSFGEDRSLLKDTVTQLMGNLAAIAHIPMADEILKDTFANHAFENFEIAAYKSLIAMAEATGHNQVVPALQQTLKEEQKTAQLIHDQIEPITRRYMMLEQSGQSGKI